jgi:ATP-binding cassette subfamily B protein
VTLARRHSLKNLLRLWSYIRKYSFTMSWMLVAAAAGTGVGLLIPLLIRRVIDGPVQHHQPGGLLVLGLLALLLGLVEAGLTFLRRWVQSSLALDMEYRIRADLYAHLQRLPVAFHDRWQIGQLLSRLTTDLGVIRRFVSFGLIFLIVNTATYLTVVALLLHLYWPLGLVVAVSAVPLFLFSRKFTHHYLATSRRQQDQQGDVADLVEESAQGIRTIKSFGRAPHMSRRFERAARTLHDTGVAKARLLARTWAEFDTVPNVTLAIVLVGGAYAVAVGELTVGGLVAFVSLQLMLVWPIDSLGWIIANGQEAMTAADRIYEVFDQQPSIVDSPDAVALPPGKAVGRREPALGPDRQGGARREPALGPDRQGGAQLRFDGVQFRYSDADQPVLRRIDLDVAPGETIAIVGVTGSGKTSLVSLVPRLYDVTGGRITLDGRDIRELTLDSLRAAVGVAFEEATLFSMSVRENLTLGRPDATDEEIAEALAVAQAEFVYELPWGLDTRVGEQGLSLSGGQRQRLALARAVLGKPRVLVLDDPLSALDVHTEALVEEALARVLRGTTALVVVHRPSTVALADRVALLSDGEIVAVGTHSELLATVPEYRAVLSASADSDLEEVSS